MIEFIDVGKTIAVLVSIKRQSLNIVELTLRCSIEVMNKSRCSIIANYRGQDRII